MGVEQLGDLLEVITNHAFQELVKEMMPYVGIITSSMKAANAWKAVVDQARKELGWDDYTNFILPGDPLAATALYEFDRELRLMRASFGDIYWDMHRRLELEGRLTHSRDACPQRDGPPVIHVWSTTGWQVVRAPH